MKYGEIIEKFDGEKYYRTNEDDILEEAYNRLDDKLKKKFDAYEEGYGTYFKDFEQWFERYAPQIWSDVWNEAWDEQADAEEEVKQSNTDEQDEKEWREYNKMIDREYHRDRI